MTLAFDDSTGFRAVIVRGTVEIREDLPAELERFSAIRRKHGRPIPDDAQLLADLNGESRVLMAITPDGPPASWLSWGLD